MTSRLLLSTPPLPQFGLEVEEATLEGLTGAVGLLVPHDGEPVADVRARPDRWARLTLVSQAVRRGLPVLGWGAGAALLGRVLGAKVRAEPQPGLADEWAELPRDAEVVQRQGEAPLLWQAGQVTAWAGVDLPPEVLAEFLEGRTLPKGARQIDALETVGGEAGLRLLLDDFYARIQHDEVLGPIFAVHVEDWDAHLDRVTAFWVTVLSGAAVWRGNLNHVHARLGIRGVHLERWLTLFQEAAERHLSPEAARLLTWRAGAMGARLGRRGVGNRPHSRRVP
ncbi:group III truncated hemoglobin [Deinococcus hopiensis]|uniref:Hemoglobin n=1 Tax=Deinococcus hopiensis KR-140 TaxID=695939 RepID=A0A1W1VKL2_9DEIO|nr:group III truncated hemoglobin [Deinococcus hopiensis]SMB93925.1 hemoglobin [Deinococcus hopiensis KR-140]